MPKLYEITERYKNLIDLLEDPEIDPAQVLEAVNTVEEELTEKARNIAKLLKNIDGDIDAIRKEEGRLREMRKAMENKYEGLKQYLEVNLKQANIRKVDGIVPLAFRRCPCSVEIIEADRVPLTFLKPPPEPEFDKKAIKDALPEWDGNIPGVRVIDDKEYLKIG